MAAKRVGSVQLESAVRLRAREPGASGIQRAEDGVSLGSRCDLEILKHWHERYRSPGLTTRTSELRGARLVLRRAKRAAALGRTCRPFTTAQGSLNCHPVDGLVGKEVFDETIKRVAAAGEQRERVLLRLARRGVLDLSRPRTRPAIRRRSPTTARRRQRCRPSPCSSYESSRSSRCRCNESTSTESRAPA